MTHSMLTGLAVLGCLFGTAALAAGEPSSEARVHFTAGKSFAEAGTCAGEIDGVDLQRVRISSADFDKGTPCLRADFDGNGTPDYAFFHPKEVYRGGKVLVVLLQGKKVLTVTVLPHSFYNAPSVYESKHRGSGSAYSKMQKRYQCPAVEREGIVEWGEGGTTRIFGFDAASGEFLKIGECRSESS